MVSTKAKLVTVAQGKVGKKVALAISAKDDTNQEIKRKGNVVKLLTFGINSFIMLAKNQT